MAIVKVVLDTNVLVSGLAYPGSVPGKIVAAWQAGGIDVFLSDYLLEELRRVLPRLVHRHGLSDQEIDDLVDIVSFQAEVVTPLRLAEPALDDAADQPVLGTLAAAMEQWQADYLITGDKGLLALAEAYPILSPAEFWQRHGG